MQSIEAKYQKHSNSMPGRACWSCYARTPYPPTAPCIIDDIMLPRTAVSYPNTAVAAGLATSPRRATLRRC
jgi:hypothetical protein